MYTTTQSNVVVKGSGDRRVEQATVKVTRELNGYPWEKFSSTTHEELCNGGKIDYMESLLMSEAS